jgi:uncharacterized membrane protein
LLDSFSPNLLSFMAAILVSVAQTLFRTGLTHLNPTATALMMNMTTVTLAAMLYFYLDEGGPWSLEAAFWFALVGFSGGSFGRYFNFQAVKLIGLARTSVLIQSLLIWTAVLGVMFLGERLTLGVAAGTLAIMFGAVLLVYEKEDGKRNYSLWLYLLPLMAAFAYSVTFLFRKYGLALMPSPPFGMVVASGSASLLLMCAMPFTEGKSSKPEWHFGSLAFVGLGASFNFMAMVLFWNALRDGEIVRVVPINRLSVLFVIFFSWFFFRKQEAVTFRVVAGGILSVVGAFVIVWGK